MCMFVRGRERQREAVHWPKLDQKPPCCFSVWISLQEPIIQVKGSFVSSHIKPPACSRAIPSTAPQVKSLVVGSRPLGVGSGSWRYDTLVVDPWSGSWRNDTLVGDPWSGSWRYDTLVVGQTHLACLFLSSRSRVAT